MSGLGYDVTKVQDIINQSCQKALKRKCPSSGKWQSLEDRLLDCYVESCEGAPKDKRFCHGVHLLEKVVLQDNLSTLVVNLYPNNEGYSLMLKGKNGSESETVKLPYEETEFLDYLDAQELPPILVDLLEKSQANIFYSGCVIVEVRDYRQTSNSSSYDTKYVLLKPTYQSLVCDVNNLTSDPAWSVDDKLALEAQLLLATEGPLCLDPSPEVGLVANQLQFNLKKFNSPALRSCLRSSGQAFQTRMAVTSASPAPSSLKLMDFLGRYKKPQPPVNLRLAKTPHNTDSWKQKPVHLGVPSRLDVDLYAKMIERPKITSDNSPETVQEITLEGEKTNNRNYYCKVTIRRRPTDLQYLGELYLEEDTGSNNHNGQGRGREEAATAPRGGRACQFFLGSKLSAQKYLQQFQDLYTEEGRKSVKICSYTPGQQQHSTQGTPTSSNSSTTNQCASQNTQDSTSSEAVLKTISEEKNEGRNTPSSTLTGIPSFVVATSHEAVSISSLPTYGQKLAAFQQQQQQQQRQQQGVMGTQVVTVNNVVNSATLAKTAPAVNRKGSFVTTSSPVHVSVGKSAAVLSTSTKTQPSVLIRRQSQVDQTTSGAARQSPTTPTGVYPGVVGTYMQSVVASGSTVTLPVSVTVAGTTPIVSVNNGNNTITAGNLQAQFIAAGIKTTGQPIQPAPPTPLTLLQGTTAIQSQQPQLAQGRQPTATFTLPGNLVPISQIPPGGVATLNAAQIQAKTSPQTTLAGQPTPILPNTPMSPQSGMTTVTINARPILPQQPQGQQQRKISAGRALINRGAASTIQPLVPLGGQLAPAGSQLQQQQFQVRIPVQFSQQQIQQTGQAPGQTIVQAQPGQTLVQPQSIQIQAQQVTQQQILPPQVQVQVKQTAQHGVTSKGSGKTSGQRRRSQNK